MWPLASVLPESGSTSWYFSDEEPELITSTSAVMNALRLDRGDGDGVDDVFDQRTPRQVVHRFAQALQHRTDRDRARTSLHRLVRVVAGVEVGKDQHRR